mmetsp:Transcript_30613/g.70080  ORF Transcript_30613/g.70080 Transcript_30613/m.70080 type:complete len:105 (-) Transcript_30613:3700-4014(-)
MSNPITEWIRSGMEDPADREKRAADRVYLLDIKGKKRAFEWAYEEFKPVLVGKPIDPRPFLHRPVKTAANQDSQQISYGVDLLDVRSDMMKKRIAEACEALKND